MMGNRIKQLIREKGYTYESLGAEIGITAQGISEIVRGKSQGATGRYAIASALGVRVVELWPEEPAREEPVQSVF